MAASDPSNATLVVFDPGLTAIAETTDDRLASYTERHKHVLAPTLEFQTIGSIEQELRRRPANAGLLIKLDSGLPPRWLLKTTSRVLRTGRRVYYYWPAEGAVEVVDRIRLKSMWRHWVAYQVYTRLIARRSSRGAGAAAASDGRTTAISRLGLKLDTIGGEGSTWQSGNAALVSDIDKLQRTRDRIATAHAGGERPLLVAALQDYAASLKVAIDRMRRAQLASNRISFSLQDIANEAAQPAIASVIDPTHVQGYRNLVLGSGQQMADVAANCEANLPGIINTAGEVQGAIDATGAAPAPGAPSAYDKSMQTVLMLAEAFENNLRSVSETSSNAIGKLGELQQHLSERMAELSAVPAPAAPVAAAHASPHPSPDLVLTLTRTQLDALRVRIAPVPFPLSHAPTAPRPLNGTGVYLRTDYWAPIISGGSYGHTCYQAAALARTTSRFQTVVSNRFPLLDELNLNQVVVRPDGFDSNESSLLRANDYYYSALKPAFEMIRPAYLFERLCLGNFAGARLSSELGIPYLVEYNGSEISMKRSFDTAPYQNEALFLAAEQLSFEQATLISVISDAVRDDVVKRGIDPAKVLVDWNAVDLQAYRPLAAAERQDLRGRLGFASGDRVVCFIGTFGGWHGIEVLAEAMPRLARADPNIKFLLIGDGGYKHLVSDAIAKSGIEARVVDAGRVPQTEGARLMAAADIFVSPHSSHMVDSRFFGSPTKLFEYMAYGVGIVASDLEQIGEVMRPALMADEAARASATSVRNERGVLTKPGSIDEFVTAVAALAKNPALATALGANARKAAQELYTWDGHVAKLWRHLGMHGQHEQKTARIG